MMKRNRVMIVLALGLGTTGCWKDDPASRPLGLAGAGTGGAAATPGVGTGGAAATTSRPTPTPHPPERPAASAFTTFMAPAGNRLTARNLVIDRHNAAILNNGRLLTPVGLELNVDAPKPFGLAVALDGKTAATINSGASRFSVSLISNITATSANVRRIPINAAFMGITFSPDGTRFYASGGENGNIWVGEAATGRIIGSVNLNGTAHPLPSPSLPEPNPTSGAIISSFRGSFPGNMVVSGTGKFLYVVDQGNFSVHVIDTNRIVTGVDADQRVTEMNNFDAVVNNVRVGRYPFGIAMSPDERRLYVANVGVFQYTHLMPRGPDRQPGGVLPPNLAGNNNEDYPLCFPAHGYPDDVEADKSLIIKKIDASTISGLPRSLRDPDGVRCGYVSADRQYTVPGLGSPNVDESSSVYVLDLAAPAMPAITHRVKTGLKVGEVEHGIPTYGASHPNAVAIGNRAVYVSNGNNDSKFFRFVATAAAMVMLAVLIAPVFGLKIGQADIRSLAKSGPSYDTLQVLSDGGVGTGVLTPIEVLVPNADAEAAAEAARGVDGIQMAVVGGDAEMAVIDVIPEKETVESSSIEPWSTPYAQRSKAQSRRGLRRRRGGRRR